MNRAAGRAAQALAGASLLFLATACAVGPDFERPRAPQAQRYTPGPTPVAPGQSFAPGPVPAKWWSKFGSATLDAWVEEGLAHNRDLAATVDSLLAARERLRAQLGSSELPTVNGQLEFERQRAIGLPNFGPPTILYRVYAGAVQVSYDLDLFGATRRANEAARAGFEVQQQELAAARQTLAANIVVTAIRAAALGRELGLQERIESLAAQRARLTLRRYELGGAAHREVLEAQRAHHDAAAALPGLRAQQARTRHALAVLLGRGPQDAPEDLDFDALQLPADVPVAVPSELVRARPDVLAAEAGLHEATAQLGVATAELLPHLSLTASYGSESYTRAGFLRSPTTVWGAGASLLQPIFAGGALLAEKRAASAELDAALQRYESTVLKAFGNVGDALRALDEDADALSHDVAAEADAQRFYEETLRRHDSGSESALAVIAGEQALLQQRLSRIAGQDARLVDTANLFQAIGAPAT